MRLDSLLTSILPTPLTVSALLLCLASALVLGILTALVFTRGCRHTASFTLTLALLPMSVALVIMMVNGSIGTGLAVAGTFALVRFRSVPGTAREIAAIFTAVAIGLAMGMGMLGVAVVFFLLAAAAVLVLTKLHFGAMPENAKVLRITVPEDVDYETALRRNAGERESPAHYRAGRCGLRNRTARRFPRAPCDGDAGKGTHRKHGHAV